MPYGYNGNILHVDLSSKKYWIEHPEENFYRTYWGGRAIGLYYMLKEMKPKTDPLSPDNLLIFAPSVLTGTPSPAMPRYRSPHPAKLIELNLDWLINEVR